MIINTLIMDPIITITLNCFHNFLFDRQWLFILWILTVSLAIIGMNGKALFVQFLLIISMYFQYVIETKYVILMLYEKWFFYADLIAFILFGLIQLVTFVLVILELVDKIRTESPEEKKNSAL